MQCILGRGLGPIAVLAILGGSAPAPARADILLAGAAARGIFGWEAIGGYERVLPWKNPRIPLDFPARVEGHFATRNRVTNMVVSNYLLAHLVIPGFEESAFAPYLATGPGFHIQGVWSDLGAFGGVLTEGEATLKWHVLLGARLARGARTDVYAEGRYTKPGPFEFDYLAVGLRFHGPSTAPSKAPNKP